jgi:hypothetical protein
MADPKFTPGPLGWMSVAAKASGGAHIYLIDAADRKIAALWGGAEEKRANADLFSVAPEMYRLLIAARHALRSYQFGNGSPDLAEEIADKANELLARARGKTG